MADQFLFTVNGLERGIHLITDKVICEIADNDIKLPKSGLLHLFTCHTSCALSLCENCDPDVRLDMEKDLDRIIPENNPYYKHTLEGPDDMPSHTKSVIVGPDITIPIVNGNLYLGTWQGIYFFEFRNNPGTRKFVATIVE